MTQQAPAHQDFASALTAEQIKQLRRETRRENWGRAWYKFSRNPLSIVGGATVLFVVLLAIFAPVIAPYPKHVKPFVDFDNASRPPLETNRATSARTAEPRRNTVRLFAVTEPVRKTALPIWRPTAKALTADAETRAIPV